MDFRIKIKDINELHSSEVVALYTRLSWPYSESNSALRPELKKRYIAPTPGPHPAMALAIIWLEGAIAGWVGTRAWPEKLKGEPITAQTIECFVDPELRNRGLAQLGLQALMSAGRIARDKPVAVYHKSVVKIAERCGCKIVLLCEAN